MDSHIADKRLKDLHVEEIKVKTGADARATAQYEIDPLREKALVRKLDVRVVPILWFLFMLAFLDRTNIGNARIQGMTADLNMKGNDYNIALFIFFIPYILFEVPSNILIKRMAPSTWIALIMTLWGIATIGQGLIRNNAGLQAMRFLLGLFEAGFFPGCVYLISMYYKRYELQWRLSIFFTGSILAGAFSGLLAYAIAKMDGVAGYSGWRWIFILEGIFTTVVGLCAKWFIPDWPETAKFLTHEEKELLVARLATDVADAKMNRLDKKAFFTPTIITQLGYRAEAAQVRSIPIFIVATVFCLLTAYLTDRLRHRYTFTLLGCIIATIGYSILLNQSRVTTGIQYMAIFFIVTGGYMCQPVTLAWVNNCMSGHYKRSVSSAMMVGFGNAGGIVASNIFLTSEQPGFKTGYGVSLGLVWVCAVACLVLLLGVRWENAKRERGERDWRLEDVETRDNLGDDHPRFRFTY
ncbi:putative transporter [Pseudocercospora fuligena]|uniref:Putative transporter n=1 Tax=Pseudocercospora fuligena TaxID=685502 RepID=A0A8H6VIU6_9PEZI|nr:putative transporter [Pseudocercospora fuligena]